VRQRLECFGYGSTSRGLFEWLTRTGPEEDWHATEIRKLPPHCNRRARRSFCTLGTLSISRRTAPQGCELSTTRLGEMRTKHMWPAMPRALHCRRRQFMKPDEPSQPTDH